MNTTLNSFLLALVLAVAFAEVGCGKKQTPASAPEPADAIVSNTPAAIARPAPVVNPIVVPEATAVDSSQVLAALTQALRKYAVERKGLPASFSELVSAGYVKNPPAPPPGRRFEIDAKSARVVLVNQ